MAFGSYCGPGYQPAYYAPGGAIPDMLNQYKGQYQPTPPAPQQNGSGLIWVQGESGAKSFMVGPGQSVLLMDSEAMRFYLKSADNSGMPLPLRVFEYQEITGRPEAQPQAVHSLDPEKYVTWERLEERLSALTAAGEKTKQKEEKEDE